MMELPVRIPASALQELIQQTLPQTMNTDSKLELVIAFRESGMELNAMSHFLRLIDRIYGHLHPGGLEGYLSNQESKLQITALKQSASEWVISKAISEPADARTFVVLHLLLKCLPHLKSFSKIPSTAGDETARKKTMNLLLAKNHIYIQRTLSEDPALKGLSGPSKNHLSSFLSDLLLREHRLSNAAIQFSRTGLKNVSINVHTVHAPIPKKPAANGRIYLERPIMATLVQGGRSYASQMIEYSANGAGLSLLISDLSQDKKENIVDQTQDISVRIGNKKCTGSVIHQSHRGIGLFLGIQLRYPVQNWDAIIH